MFPSPLLLKSNSLLILGGYFAVSDSPPPLYLWDGPPTDTDTNTHGVRAEFWPWEAKI